MLQVSCVVKSGIVFLQTLEMRSKQRSEKDDSSYQEENQNHGLEVEQVGIVREMKQASTWDTTAYHACGIWSPRINWKSWIQHEKALKTLSWVRKNCLVILFGHNGLLWILLRRGAKRFLVHSFRRCRIQLYLMYQIDGLLIWIPKEDTNTSLKLSPSKLGYLRMRQQRIGR